MTEEQLQEIEKHLRDRDPYDPESGIDITNKGLDLIAEVRRLTASLHGRMAHPDFEYALTNGPRKAWDVHAPEGDGWEPNDDYRGGFERFDYHEEAYWRRRRA